MDLDTVATIIGWLFLLAFIWSIGNLLGRLATEYTIFPATRAIARAVMNRFRRSR